MYLDFFFAECMDGLPTRPPFLDLFHQDDQTKGNVWSKSWATRKSNGPNHVERSCRGVDSHNGRWLKFEHPWPRLRLRIRLAQLPASRGQKILWRTLYCGKDFKLPRYVLQKVPQCSCIDLLDPFMGEKEVSMTRQDDPKFIPLFIACICPFYNCQAKSEYCCCSCCNIISSYRRNVDTSAFSKLPTCRRVQTTVGLISLQQRYKGFFPKIGWLFKG